MAAKATETQLAIIGGGIVGTAIAHALCRYKVDICLLEREPAVGFGITKASQGGVQGGISIYMSRIVKWWAGAGDLRAYLTRLHHLKDRLSDPGTRMYIELEHFLNARLLRCGGIVVAETKDDIKTMKLLKELAEARGAKGITLLDKDGLREQEPLIDSRFIGGLYDPNEGSVISTEWATAFAENAAQNGAHILLNTEVRGIEEKNGGYLIKTNKGSVKAEYVVNAAGIFSDEVANMIGKIDFSFVKWKCQMLVLENRNYISHIITTIPKPQGPRNLWLTPDGNILASHTMDATDNKDDLSTTKEGLDSLSSYLNFFIPEVQPSIVRGFAGIMHFNTRNPDDYLLECPKRRFVNVVACPPAGGPAPALAVEVAKMLSDEGLELVEKSDFNPHRHVEPRFIELPTEEKNRKIQVNRGYGHIICRCEKVAEEEIRQAIRAGATTTDDIKFRTRAGMGRCQGGFCTSRVLRIMAEEMGISPLEITQRGGNSYVLECETKALNRG